MIKNIKIFGYSFIFLLIVLLDRISKSLALTFLTDKDHSVFTGLNLSLVKNRGVSWGLFSFQSSHMFYILALIIFLVIVGFIFYILDLFKNNESVFFEIMVLAGAISNLLDRFLYKGVIDFIDVYINSYHWPTFNIADIFVVIGILGIIGRFLIDGYLRKN